MSEPLHLYKYRSVSTVRDMSRVRDIIQKHQIWFSFANSFNDPFDCAPAVKTTYTTESLTYLAERVADRRTKGQPEHIRQAERDRLVAAMLNDPTPTPEVDASALATVRKATSQIGVYSLSADPAQVLMWSHYSDCHTGICLRFRRDIHSIIETAMPAIYQEDRPVVDLVGDRDNVMEKSLLRKAEFWRYEDEWRIVRASTQGSYDFPPEVLDGIIFGARIKPEKEKLLRSYAKAGGLDVEFLRAVPDEEEFKINIVPA